MKRVSVFLAAVLAVTVLFGGVMPSQAASAEVGIEIKATDINMAVTVPSQIPIIFNEDGTNTYPQNWTIVNESEIAGVYLDTVRMTQAEGGWYLAHNVLGQKDLAVNSKHIKFYMGKPGDLKIINPQGGMVTSQGESSFANTLPIPAGEELTLDFKVERGAFTESFNMQKAFDMEFTFVFM